MSVWILSHPGQSSLYTPRSSDSSKTESAGIPAGHVQYGGVTETLPLPPAARPGPVTVIQEPLSDSEPLNFQDDGV